MARKIYGNGGGKLIRDRIPEIMGAKGITYEVREATDEEFVLAANAKMVEELLEIFEAEKIEDPEERRQEATKESLDLLEIWEVVHKNNLFQPFHELNVFIDRLIKRYNLDRHGELYRLKAKRREERGGFDKKLLLLWTEEST